MAQVTVLRRELVTALTPDGRAEERIAVTYSTPVIPPRRVFLPLTLYRPATPQEIQNNPRFSHLPKDQNAQSEELKAIAQDIDLISRAPPQLFELP